MCHSGWGLTNQARRNVPDASHYQWMSEEEACVWNTVPVKQEELVCVYHATRAPSNVADFSVCLCWRRESLTHVSLCSLAVCSCLWWWWVITISILKSLMSCLFFSVYIITFFHSFHVCVSIRLIYNCNYFYFVCFFNFLSSVTVPHHYIITSDTFYFNHTIVFSMLMRFIYM